MKLKLQNTFTVLLYVYCIFCLKIYINVLMTVFQDAIHYHKQNIIIPFFWGRGGRHWDLLSLFLHLFPFSLYSLSLCRISLQSFKLSFQFINCNFSLDTFSLVNAPLCWLPGGRLGDRRQLHWFTVCPHPAIIANTTHRLYWFYDQFLKVQRAGSLVSVKWALHHATLSVSANFCFKRGPSFLVLVWIYNVQCNCIESFGLPFQLSEQQILLSGKM